MSCMAINTAVPTSSVKGVRPRTKTETYCLAHASALPPLTPAQMKWARMKPTGVVYFEGRGKNYKAYLWCHHCGRVEQIDIPSPLEYLAKDTKLTCYHCGQKLQIVSGDRENEVEHNTTFGVLTLHEGWQVVRWFNWRITVSRNAQPTDHIEEVMQLWIDLEHSKLCLLHKPYLNNFYRFRWTHGEEWRVRHSPYQAIHDGSYTYYPVFDLTHVNYYPHCKVLPILKRNGWKDKMVNANVNLMDMLLAIYKKPIAESLAKWKQYDMLQYYVKYDSEKVKYYMHAIRIASRHGYIIKDPGIWLDYLSQMDFFDLDTHNPKLIIPDDLRAAHDALVNRKKRIEQKKHREELLAQAVKHEASYKKHRGMFFGLHFESDSIKVHVISSVQEMADEGEAMHHCVYENAYYSHRDHPYSLILSARDNGGNRLETIEVNIKRWSIVQSRALLNGQTPQHQDIIDLVNRNIPLLRKTWDEQSKQPMSA